MKIKGLLIVLVIMMAVSGSLFAAGGTTPASDSGPAVLDVLISQNPASLGDFTTKGYYKHILETFNIDLQIQAMARSAFNDRINIVLATGDMPDFIAGAGHLSVEEVNRFGEQGIIKELSEHLGDMPNLSKWFRRYPAELDRLSDSEGRLFTFGAGSRVPVFDDSTMVRIDMLKPYGYDNVDDVDSFEEYLEMFRTLKKANDGKPVLGNPGGGFGRLIALPMYALGRSTESVFYDQDTKKYGYPFYGNEAKDAISFVRTMIEEGIYEPNVLSRAGSEEFDDLYGILNWPALMADSSQRAYNVTARTVKNNPDEYADAVTVAVPPIKYKGKLYLWPIEYMMDPHIIVGPDPKNVGKLIEFIDHLYSVESFIELRFGIEGENYAMVDGLPRLLYDMPAISYRFPDGYTLPRPLGTVDDRVEWSDGWGRVNEFGMMKELWEAAGQHIRNDADNHFMNDYVPKYQPVHDGPPWPVVTFTDDESEEILSLTVALDTASSESIGRILAGMADLDTEWAELQTMLEKLNVKRFISLYNEAYDRSK